MSSVVEPQAGNEYPPRTPFQLHQFMTPLQRQGSAAFKRELGRLLKEAPGQWVAFRGDQQIALSPTCEALFAQLKVLGAVPRETNVACIEPLPPPIDLRLFRGRLGHF